MASIIPKIKIGLAAGKREKHNLSFDCSTTANIGTVQPTMCREMIPNSKFKVKVSSLIRLSSMPVPTFGRMSMRNYHSFVPYEDLWQPYNALLSGQHYRSTYTNSSFIPTKVPYFTMAKLRKFITSYSDICIAPKDDIDNPYTITMTNTDWAGVTYPVGDGEGEYATMALAIKAAQAADLARIQAAWSNLRSNNTLLGETIGGKLFELGRGTLASDDKGVIFLGNFVASVPYSTNTLKINYEGDAQNSNVFADFDKTYSFTTEGADLISVSGNYAVLFRFKAPLKRLRQIFIGLGYQFSPYNTLEFSVLKLLAYYKVWFNLFCPNRERAFVDTNCYALIKNISEKDGQNVGTTAGNTDLFDAFITDLMTECYYYLPMDYFSMAVTKPAIGNQDTQFTMNSGDYDTVGSLDQQYGRVNVASASSTITTNPRVDLQNYSAAESPLTMRLAQRMLTWANKNTVLGRSIREYLKVHFGVTDVNQIDDGGVVRIGASRTNIQISDVMSTAENSEGYLGEYAGKGVGYGDSETFDYTAKQFGVWITMSVIVPESGYYQGYLAENRHLNRYQFFQPEFDALGYQVLERGEVMDDYTCDNGTAGTWCPVDGSNTRNFDRSKAFGFVPRYSEYKVGRNIVNGDLSLQSLRASMAPYTLDRRISVGAVDISALDSNGNVKHSIAKPDFVPSVVYDNFRRIDPTDHLGQYNRIFNYVENDLDHFIIHNIFDVVCFAPMKSLSTAFDTMTKDDDGSIDVTHS